MCRKPNVMSAIDAQDIMARAYANARDLLDMGVQVAFIANGASATIELSAYRRGDGLKTLSVIFFPADKDKKLSFTDGVIDEMRHADPYDVIIRSMAAYKNQFIF